MMHITLSVSQSSAKVLTDQGIAMRIALEEVQSAIPSVNSVSFDEALRWEFRDASGNVPSFEDVDIDIGLLEDAAATVVSPPLSVTM